MKRKRSDRINWARITKRRFAMTHIDSAEFTGYATLLCIDDVKEPLWLRLHQQDADVCIVDCGYQWLQQFPRGQRHAVTTMFDAQGEVIEWYIDILKQHGLDECGVLYYDDLYLDVEVSPAGHIHLLDVDELDEALQRGVVSTMDYNLAWREAHTVMTALEEDRFPLLWACDAHREQLLALVNAL